MSEEKAIVARIVPKLEGLREIEEALEEVSDALLYARGLLDKVKTMTVEVTAFTEVGDAKDSR